MRPDPYSGSYDSFNPQSFNRYAYVLNSPLGATDGSGLNLVYTCDDNGNCYTYDDGVPPTDTPVPPDVNCNDMNTVCYDPPTVDPIIPPIQLNPGEPGAPNNNCPAGPSKIVSVSATTNAPTIAAGALIGEAIGGPPGAFAGGIIGSLFGVGGSVSYVPSTNSWYAGPTAVFAPGLGGGNGISANYVNVPAGQNAHSIANGASYSITFQPNPFFGSVVTKSPGSGPPVVGPSVGTRVPVSFGAGYNFCLHNCGCAK